MVELHNQLMSFSVLVDVFDPWINVNATKDETGIECS